MSDLRIALVFQGVDQSTPVANAVAGGVKGVGIAAFAASKATTPLNRLAEAASKAKSEIFGIGGGQKAIDGVVSSLGGVASKLKEIASVSLKGVGDIGKGIGQRINRVGEGLQQAGTPYGGIAATVGGGFEAREIISENDFFNRIRIMSGASIEQIDRVREHLLEAARDARVSSDELRDAFGAMRAGGMPLADIDQTLEVTGAAIQRLGGHGAEIGELFANLRKFDDIKGPDQLLQGLATLSLQLKGIPGGLEAFTEATAPLLAQYREMGHAGPDALKEIGAVYATIAPGTATPRQARSATESVLSLFANRQTGLQLQSMGVDVYGHDKKEAQANFEAGKTLPLTQILQSLLQQYVKAPAVFDQVLGPGFRSDFKIPLGETKQQGFSPTLDAKLQAQGDPAQFMRQAKEASEGLQGSMNSLSASLKIVGEEVLSTPFGWLANVLNRFNGEAAVGITVIGGLGIAATAGHSIIWLAQGLTKANVALTVMRAGAMAFIPSLSGISLGIATAAESMAGLVGFSPVLAGFFTTISGGFLAVGAAIEATPIGWIITGVAAVAAAAYLIYENWTPIKAWFGELWADVCQIFGGFTDFVFGVFTLDSNKAIGGLETAWDGFQKYFTDYWDGIVGTVETAWNKITSIGDMMPDWVTGKKEKSAVEPPKPTTALEQAAKPAAPVMPAVKPPAPTSSVPLVAPLAPVGLTQPPSSAASDSASLPRGLRNNNPLNLVYARQAGTDPDSPSDGRFARFTTFDGGVTAATRQLLRDQARGDLTPRQLIQRWAPPNENQTGAYVANVSRSTGLDPDAAVNLHDANITAALEAAMAKVETGRSLDPALFQRGVTEALAGAAQPAAARLDGTRPTLVAQSSPSLAERLAANPVLGPPVPTAFGPDAGAKPDDAPRRAQDRAEILVTFDNAPRGMRVNAPDPGAAGPRISTSVGYSFAAS